tara:strand:+ start:2121 stop:2609 length:489 start_codon:yes stop_codon:yes gene_type:complete
MKKLTLLFIGFSLAIAMGFSLHSISASADAQTNNFKNESMKLGAFSVSLSVKDLKVSKAFYENLGFEVLGGDLSKNYLIMKNENSLIGLFQGMFEGNILTFNPGWDENGKNIASFDDIRAIQKSLSANGISSSPEIDTNSTGPASLTLTDPDGNMILIDQHR